MQNKETLLAQAQLEVICAQVGLKEYAANWLKEAGTVTRDTSGRFASRATGILLNEQFTEAREKIHSGTGHIGKLVDQLDSYIKDPELAKKKISTELIKLAGRGLDKLVEKNPKFADILLDKMFGIDAQKARDNLADLYGKINPGLPNAIKPNPFAELVNDLKGLKKGRDPKELVKDLGRAFERTAYEYEKLIYELNNVESDSEAIKQLGKIAAASLPIATYLGFALTPELVMGLIFQESLPVILTSFAAGEAASLGVNKAMDELEIENFPLRLAVDILASTAASISVAGGIKAIEKSGIVEKLKSTDFKALAEKKIKEFNKIKSKATASSSEIPSLDQILEETGGKVDLEDFEPIFDKRPKNLSPDVEFEQTPYGTAFKFKIEDHDFLMGIGDDGITAFKVNGQFDMDSSLPDNVKRRGGVKLTKVFKSIVQDVEDGKILWCTAHNKDGAEATARRVKAYKMMGFGEEVEGCSYGIVENGKLKPYTPTKQELERIHQ